MSFSEKKPEWFWRSLCWFQVSSLIPFSRPFCCKTDITQMKNLQKNNSNTLCVSITADFWSDLLFSGEMKQRARMPYLHHLMRSSERHKNVHFLVFSLKVSFASHKATKMKWTGTDYVQILNSILSNWLNFTLLKNRSHISGFNIDLSVEYYFLWWVESTFSICSPDKSSKAISMISLFHLLII